jgi:hypothetical protein
VDAKQHRKSLTRMTEVLQEVLAAHGGLDRWRSVTALTVHGTFGGLLQSRFPGNRMTEVTARVCMSEQHVVFEGFPDDVHRAVFDRGDVRVETAGGEVIATRAQARNAFRGAGAVRRTVRWNALDATYFAGYAWWNYLSVPLLLARDDITVAEITRARGECGRRLEVTFPAHLHTHCARQIFHVDGAGLIRRHDYTAEPVGRWARAAHHCERHREFGGLAFPTRRRVRPRAPGGHSLPGPTLVALDIDHLVVERVAG